MCASINFRHNLTGFMNPRDMDRTHQSDRAYQHSRRDDDTNYDHVTMDMSEVISMQNYFRITIFFCTLKMMYRSI